MFDNNNNKPGRATRQTAAGRRERVACRFWLSSRMSNQLVYNTSFGVFVAKNTIEKYMTKKKDQKRRPKRRKNRVVTQWRTLGFTKEGKPMPPRTKPKDRLTASEVKI